MSDSIMVSEVNTKILAVVLFYDMRWFSPLSLLCLSKTCRAFRKAIGTKWKEALIGRMARLVVKIFPERFFPLGAVNRDRAEPPIEMLLNIMQDGGFITGSILFAALIGDRSAVDDNLMPNDLDIVVPLDADATLKCMHQPHKDHPIYRAETLMPCVSNWSDDGNLIQSNCYHENDHYYIPGESCIHPLGTSHPFIRLMCSDLGVVARETYHRDQAGFQEVAQCVVVSNPHNSRQKKYFDCVFAKNTLGYSNFGFVTKLVGTGDVPALQNVFGLDSDGMPRLFIRSLTDLVHRTVDLNLSDLNSDQARVASKYIGRGMLTGTYTADASSSDDLMKLSIVTHRRIPSSITFSDGKLTYSYTKDIVLRSEETPIADSNSTIIYVPDEAQPDDFDIPDLPNLNPVDLDVLNNWPPLLQIPTGQHDL
jgi:hypothetical protein